MEFSPEQWESFVNILQHIADDPATIGEQERIKGLIAKIHREGKKGTRQTALKEKKQTDRRKRANSAVAQAQQSGYATAFLAPPASMPKSHLNIPIPCYICKALYTELHPFYHSLCPACAVQNYAKRFQHADLTGRTALLTGGRLKIGYQTALKLLRDGARVILTTRFPCDAAQRFASEEDFESWAGRLQIYGIDLRNVPAVESLARFLLGTESALDIVIHNAAQTVKRPPEFYAPQLQVEQQYSTLSKAIQALIVNVDTYRPALANTPIKQIAASLKNETALVLPDLLDADGQPLDLRSANSWSLRLSEVSAVEMLEVQLVNVVAPFLLNGQLKPLLMRSPFPRRFIVNVSAMEGQFNRTNKTDRHPHTNMAKAALNMMTRTSAQDYARDGIYMNSVDTGWITEENPHPKKTRLQEERGFYTPLDVIDGAARIYDPIVQGIVCPDEPLYGHFLKDYAPYAW